jgi:hypothetical protein
MMAASAPAGAQPAGTRQARQTVDAGRFGPLSVLEGSGSSHFRHTFAAQLPQFAHIHDTFLFYDRLVVN